MANYWLVMLDEENFRYSVERGIYGLPKAAAEMAKRIKPGDRLIVYVMKEGCRELCQSFAAVLEVAGEWRRSTGPLWPDEVREGRVKYGWVVDVRTVVSGRVGLSAVRERLGRMLGVEELDARRLRLYAYAKRPLPRGVGEFLEGALLRSAGGHGELVDAVAEIGELLGFRVEREYRIDNFRVDAAFFKPPRATPLAVVEVHVGGDVYKDLAALKHAYDRYGSKLVYVLARDEEAVLKLLDESLQGAFHEIRDVVLVVKASELLELRRALRLEGARNLLRWLVLVR